jgi:pyruvate ferredoxin oxidoreductase alpha subunit
VSGRKYGNGLIDPYFLEDADIAAICVGSTAGTTKSVVDTLRSRGIKAGLLRLRTLRPLPKNDIIAALASTKAVAVMDRSNSFGGHGGPLFHEIRHVLYDIQPHPHVVNYIYGLGGRDMPPKDIQDIYVDLQKIQQNNVVDNYVNFVGVRD